MKGRNGHLTFIASSKAFASLTVGSVNKDWSICSFFISNNPFNAGNKSCELQINRAVARTLIRGCIFIYSGSARLISFEINFISKETSRAEPEYMNIHPPRPQIAF